MKIIALKILKYISIVVCFLFCSCSYTKINRYSITGKEWIWQYVLPIDTIQKSSFAYYLLNIGVNSNVWEFNENGIIITNNLKEKYKYKLDKKGVLYINLIESKHEINDTFKIIELNDTILKIRGVDRNCIEINKDSFKFSRDSIVVKFRRSR